MKKLYVNGELVATGDYKIEEVNAEPTYSVRIERDVGRHIKGVKTLITN